MSGAYTQGMNAEAKTAWCAECIATVVTVLLVVGVPTMVRTVLYPDPFDMSTAANLILHLTSCVVFATLYMVWHWRRRAKAVRNGISG